MAVIILDKTKSKPWVRPSDRYDPVRYAWKIAHGDLFLNVYELAKEEKFKHLMQLIDWDECNPWINSVEPASGYKPTKGLTFNKVKEEIEKSMNKKTVKDIDRIVITKNDLNGVLLRAYSGDEIIEKTIAKCNPNDIFDFNIGAKLAVDRLYDGYDMTPKSKRKPYNGKIFVARYPGMALRDNTLYTVTNGIINGCLFGRDPFIYEGMNDADLSNAILLWVYGPCDQSEQCVAYFVR